MTITRPRKARMLEAAGLQYVAGWLVKDKAQEVIAQIDAEKPNVAAIIEKQITPSGL